MARYRLKLIMLLALLGLILLLVPAWQVYSFAQLDQTQPADAAIVLGAAVFRNRPSPAFRARIDHAINLYDQGYVDYLIFTGGLGNRDSLTEAEVARNYAIDQGVPPDHILFENESTDTISNLQNVGQLVATNENLNTFILVSTPFHMKRASLIADAVGLQTYSSPTRTTRWRSSYTKFRAYSREVAALIWYYVVDSNLSERLS
ncbi:MAG TPA: YdcF family protein [Anaerolineae bacterium]|nr:YdcF family protein [Anaerolineae bacterium]